MKTITVSDEHYEFLVEAQKELLTQDNRCTRDVVYCIEDVRESPTSDDYSSGYKWMNVENDYECICGSNNKNVDEFEALVNYLSSVPKTPPFRGGMKGTKYFKFFEKM